MMTTVNLGQVQMRSNRAAVLEEVIHKLKHCTIVAFIPMHLILNRDN